jgi:hypothetical protein
VTLSQSVSLVFVGSLVCGILGLLAGYCFGMLFPGYYHATFPPLTRMGIDLAEPGAGNGLQLGLVLGLLATTSLVLIQTWRDKGVPSQPIDQLRREIQELRQQVLDLQTSRQAGDTRALGSQHFRSADS